MLGARGNRFLIYVLFLMEEYTVFFYIDIFDKNKVCFAQVLILIAIYRFFKSRLLSTDKEDNIYPYHCYNTIYSTIHFPARDIYCGDTE